MSSTLTGDPQTSFTAMENDPFEILMTPPPRFPKSRATSVLARDYGIEGQISRLGGERDTNFRVSTDGGTYVLKIANSAEDPGITDFQNKAICHVRATDPGCPVPEVITTLNGDDSVRVTAVDDRQHTARVLGWLEGLQLHYVDDVQIAAAALGETLAQLGLALRGFEHPASNYSLLWDLKNAGQLRKLLGRNDDERSRETCRRQIDRFVGVVEPALGRLRSQVIHNDLNPGNVLVDENSQNRVTGIIDFGDIVRSPLVVDVAVACAYLFREGDDAYRDILQFVEAYTEKVPLEAREIDVLADLIKLRMVMTILIGSWRASMYPENKEYILRNEGAARRKLQQIDARPIESITEELYGACRHDPKGEHPDG